MNPEDKTTTVNQPHRKTRLVAVIVLVVCVFALLLAVAAAWYFNARQKVAPPTELAPLVNTDDPDDPSGYNYLYGTVISIDADGVFMAMDVVGGPKPELHAKFTEHTMFYRAPESAPEERKPIARSDIAPDARVLLISEGMLADPAGMNAIELVIFASE